MRPKNTKKDRLPIMDEEFQIIMSKCKRDKKIKSNTKLKLLRAFTLAFASGARICELRALKQSDIQTIYKYKKLILSAKLTKTNTTQALMFNDKAIQLIKTIDFKDCLGDDDYLFYKNSSSNLQEPMSTTGFTKLANTYLAKYLDVLYTSHSFRAGYITRILEATANPKVAQRLARHRSVMTTIRYAGASPRQVNEALELIF